MRKRLRRLAFALQQARKYLWPALAADLRSAWSPQGRRFGLRYSSGDPRNPLNAPSPMIDLFDGPGAYDRALAEYQRKYF